MPPILRAILPRQPMFPFFPPYCLVAARQRMQFAMRAPRDKREFTAAENRGGASNG